MGFNPGAKPKTGPITPVSSALQNKIGKKTANLLFGEESDARRSDRVGPKLRKDVPSLTTYSPAQTPKINVPLNSL
jgi:hypothetical protein